MSPSGEEVHVLSNSMSCKRRSEKCNDSFVSSSCRLLSVGALTEEHLLQVKIDSREEFAHFED